MQLFPALRTAVWITALCLCLEAQSTQSKDAPVNETKGLPPRLAPTDYQAQAPAGTVTVAAEFTGHAIPTPQGTFSTEEYVAVETAVFGSPEARLKLSIDDFSLSINGKKTLLSSQPYGLILSSLKDPEWEPPSKPESKSKTSIGGGGGQNDAPPPPVHMPIELQRAMAQHVQKASLPEGDRVLPQAGLIFFQYRGKTDRIRSIELIYTGPAGKANLKLQP